MAFRCAGFFALVGAVAYLVPGVAVGDLVHSTKYRDHLVRGTTPAEVWRYMNAHPIIDPDDGPAYANITHDHDLTFTVGTRGGQCRVSDLTFRWNFVLTLPKAVDFASMSAKNRQLWTSFVAALKRHEETHRTIFLKCGARFVPAAERMTGPAGCFGMKRKVRRFIDRSYAACMDEQRVFERRDRPRMLGQPFIRAATGRQQGVQ
ncbi:DUF922 domain-containing protein [Bauldia sp.]|uniref:DUF922 domain-containing protein n=1 Tax=Bauldia sp. TaxID=2575872 RepID=UPI003BAC33CA